jgi:hypothetical protein
MLFQFSSHRSGGFRSFVVAISGLLILASAHGATTYQGAPLQVTVSNTVGNSIYNLKLSTNGPSSPNSALISGTQAPLNTDGGKHGSFDAIVWVPNSQTGTLDLIASDILKGQIVRYSGPSYGTGTVIFNWAAKGKGSGPAYPVGLSADPAGNLYVISPNCKQDPTPSLWVLPYNATTGNYGAPILIDDAFSGVKTLALAEVLVAGTAATADGAAAPAWNAGDLLVLVGDSFNARVMVYAQAAINGVIKTSISLHGPSSTAVTLAQFKGKSALPLGMDIWPPDATTQGVSLLFATVDGRLIRFDSSQNEFIADFADGFGVNVQRVKVGSYLSVPYAFVAQLVTSKGGDILQYGAPPAGGTNTKPLATISKGLEGPFGVAVTMSGSSPVADCIAPNTCSPIGPQLTLQLSGPGTVNNPALANAQILDTACTVLNDPRVQVVNNSWTCNGGTLDVANYCPGFPHTVLPPFLCGHSGASGSAFQVVEGTAIVADENANNVFFTTLLDPTVPLPGPFDLGCPNAGMIFPLVPMIAWAPRSDLPNVEGTIVEDLTTPFFIDTTGLCDKGGSNLKGASMLAFGLGLNAAPSGLGAGPGSGLPGFVTAKFNNLLATIQAATTIATNVSTELQGYVLQSQAYFNSAVNNNVVDGYSCAANSIASADAYARANFNAFQAGTPPAGNYNPLGEIDGRIWNLFLTIDAYFLMQAPNTTMPATNVPACVTLTASPTTVTSGSAAQLSWGPATPTYPLSYLPTSCTVSGSQGTLLANPFTGGASGSVSTGNLSTPGTFNASLECSTSGSTAQGLAAATVTVTAQAPQLQSIAVSSPPPTGSVPPGGQQAFVAIGTYNVGNPQDITSQVSWSSSAPAVATVSASGVATCVASTTGGTATITATGAGGMQGSAILTCQAPSLNSVTLSYITASPTIEVQQTLPLQFTATANYSDGATQDVTNSATWSSSTGSATVSAGLVTGIAAGPATIQVSYLTAPLASVAVQVTDFSATPQPFSQSTAAGATVNYALSTAALNGFNDTIGGVNCNFAPAFLATYSFSPAVSVGGTINVSVTVAANQAATTAAFQCTLASAAGDSHSVLLTVTVSGGDDIE